MEQSHFVQTSSCTRRNCIVTVSEKSFHEMQEVLASFLCATLGAEIKVLSPEQSSKLCNIDRPDLMPPRGVHSLKSKPYWIPARNHGNIVSSCGSGPVG